MALAWLSSLEPVQQNGELVAAQPRQRVSRPQARLEPARHRDQQLVADQVAEAVVDDLEAIEIEIEHREPVADAARLNSSSRRPSPSTNTARLQSPVSGSRKPTLRSRSCAIACSVVSVSDPAMRVGRAPRASHRDAAAQEQPVGAVLVADPVLVLKDVGLAGEMRLERLP